MKEHAGEGIGGGLGLLVAILLGIVNIFMMPAEAGQHYARDGRDKTISGLTGFWILLRFIGWIVWVVKAQGHLNRNWELTGPAA